VDRAKIHEIKFCKNSSLRVLQIIRKPGGEAKGLAGLFDKIGIFEKQRES